MPSGTNLARAAQPNVRRRETMSEKWTCKECGEENSSNYVDCLGCLTMRPGFASEAEQTKQVNEYLEELKRDSLEAKQERIRLNREDENLIKLQSDNQKKISDLLDRWEKITDAIERKLDSDKER